MSENEELVRQFYPDATLWRVGFTSYLYWIEDSNENELSASFNTKEWAWQNAAEAIRLKELTKED